MVCVCERVSNFDNSIFKNGGDWSYISIMWIRSGDE